MERRAHFNRLLRLLDAEREAEKEENKRALERLPAATREALGKTVTRLVIDGVETGIGGHALLALSRKPAGEELAPFHAMGQGDNVQVHFPESAGLKPADGTLYDVEEYRVAVALNGPPPEALPKGKCRVDLLGSDATYQRMRKALVTVCDAKDGRLAELRDIALGLEKSRPSSLSPAAPAGFFDVALNRFQRTAVERALAARDLAVIHGPPGTGKTTVLVELIRQEAARGKRVLASGPSNVSVDNMLEKLLGTGLRVVRLGHPARTLESLRHATLSARIAAHESQKEIRELDAWRENLARRGTRRRLDRQEERARQAEIRRLWKEARDLEFSLGRRIVSESQVVLATHAGLGKQARGRFDVAVMDEASQAVEPLSWVPLAVADKAVFAGDPMQLPPTLYSKEAAEGGLAATLFERLQQLLPDEARMLLRVQYRMHEDIMGFSSSRFYEGKLIADESVRLHTASGLQGVLATDMTEAPLVFVDTAGTGFEESFDELLQSRENEGEARLAATLAQALIAAGIEPKDLAIITPYAAQARKLKSLCRVPGLEIGTVDGFQGREKEAVIVSLVRSNDKGEIGFLGDTRRMNVAMTRARRLLIVLGDSATISRHPFYASFLEYVETKGVLRSAWEWPA